MNLISCANCGVVLDKNRLVFPDIYDDDGCVVRGLAEWTGDKYVAVVSCPVCKGSILEEE